MRNDGGCVAPKKAANTCTHTHTHTYTHTHSVCVCAKWAWLKMKLWFESTFPLWTPGLEPPPSFAGSNLSDATQPPWTSVLREEQLRSSDQELRPLRAQLRSRVEEAKASWTGCPVYLGFHVLKIFFHYIYGPVFRVATPPPPPHMVWVPQNPVPRPPGPRPRAPGSCHLRSHPHPDPLNSHPDTPAPPPPGQANPQPTINQP